MNDESRTDELLSLSSSLDKVHAKSIIQMEGAMAHNKDLVVELNEKGVIGDDEITQKIERCFQSFLSDVENLVGSEICREIYGYLPGEDLAFIGDFRPTEGLDELDAAIQDWSEALKEIEDTKTSEIRQASMNLDLASKNIMSRFNAERQKLGEISSMLMEEADKITGFIPMVKAKPAPEELSKAILQVAEEINVMSNKLFVAGDE